MYYDIDLIKVGKNFSRVTINIRYLDINHPGYFKHHELVLSAYLGIWYDERGTSMPHNYDNGWKNRIFTYRVCDIAIIPLLLWCGRADVVISPLI